MSKLKNYKIRIASLQDAREIYQIYEPYILNTPITFETEPIPLEAFQERMNKVLNKFPWLVCERDGRIIGYAYASLYRERAAFAWDCECSVYIKEGEHHKGIATLLYNKLFDILKDQGYYRVYSLITYPNEGSVGLHKKFGFTEIALLKNTGYKLGAWRDMIVLEKELVPISENPKPTKTYLEIENKTNLKMQK